MPGSSGQRGFKLSETEQSQTLHYRGRKEKALEKRLHEEGTINESPHMALRNEYNPVRPLAR